MEEVLLVTRFRKLATDKENSTVMKAVKVFAYIVILVEFLALASSTSCYNLA